MIHGRIVTRIGILALVLLYNSILAARKADVMQALDLYMPQVLREWVEETYYAQVNYQARLEAMMQDEGFLHAPAEHVSLYTDHGVVHVRDVAAQILTVLETINGVLIPQRTANRLNTFMKSYGVILAYLHDIGMADFSAFGRAMHPEFAAQQVFRPEFDTFVQTIWDENWGNIAWRLLNLGEETLGAPPPLVMRELLAMSNGHSKSKVPVATLNDPHTLRETMLATLSTSLDTLYGEYLAQKGRDRANAQAEGLPPPDLSRHYDDFAQQGYAWMLYDDPAVAELLSDVVDVLRALRCADALRQRGTVLKTSGSYEIFVDQNTANAIYALRYGSDRLFMLEMAKPITAGEANLAASELEHDGNLRIAFQRGRFADAETIDRAANYAAIVINDMQADIIDSFQRHDHSEVPKRHDEILVLLESTDDNVEFAEQVCAHVAASNPSLQGQVCAVPSLQHVSDMERKIYLQSEDVDWGEVNQEQLLHALAVSGQNLQDFEPEKAFQHVRLVQIRDGDTLIEAGSPASFVYIPFDEGLKIIPLGGYQTFSVQAWMPLGNTGVIRGAVRNATVVSERNMKLLMIPKEVFLRYWHKPFTANELIHKLQQDTNW